MNVATFAGRVGADAELNYTKDGKAVASFNVAIDNGKDRDGKKRAALWIKAVLWEKKAEGLAQYIKKGSSVVVSGPVTTEAWTSKQDGSAQAKLIVTVREFTFGGGSNSDGSEERSAPAPRTSAAQAGPITDEDIPF